MEPKHMREVDAALIEAASRYTFVLVPGLYDSGPEHWQSCWQRRLSFWLRLSQRNWSVADIEIWIGSLRRMLAGVTQPAILVGHSFGALASCSLVTDRSHDIAGLMLVAPAEPGRFECEHRVSEAALGVPAVVVASHTDPLMSYQRAGHWSAAWQAELVDVGEAGHVNAEAGFGSWPYGLEVLLGLVRRIDAVCKVGASSPPC